MHAHEVVSESGPYLYAGEVLWVQACSCGAERQRGDRSTGEWYIPLSHARYTTGAPQQASPDDQLFQWRREDHGGFVLRFLGPSR